MSFKKFVASLLLGTVLFGTFAIFSDDVQSVQAAVKIEKDK